MVKLRIGDFKREDFINIDTFADMHFDEIKVEIDTDAFNPY
jgi:hypothetical protein